MACFKTHLHQKKKKKYVQKLRLNLNSCFILSDRNGIWLFHTFSNERLAATVMEKGLASRGMGADLARRS